MHLSKPGERVEDTADVHLGEPFAVEDVVEQNPDIAHLLQINQAGRAIPKMLGHHCCPLTGLRVDEVLDEQDEVGAVDRRHQVVLIHGHSR